MRVNYATALYEGEGFADVEVQQLNSKFGAKIWHMLTTGYYSRPHESMFREIACNAYDGARMAGATVADDGSPLPFLVTLPSPGSPSLIIRDYGPGMSHDFMMSRAMSIGDSTKDEDDEAVGGFGLGMKTPFVITDQFAICNYRGDHAQTYIVDKYQGQGRVMTDASMRKDANGTGAEIIIPVHDGNFTRWRDIAQNILAHFPPGSYQVENAPIKPHAYGYECEGYGVNMSANAPATVKLGPIAYPIDAYACFGGDDYEGVKPPSQGYELRFPVGALTVTPNREALQWDDKTVAAVRAAVADMVTDIHRRAKACMDGVTTLYGAMVAYTDGQRGAGSMASLWPQWIDWQGWRIDGVRFPVSHAITAINPRRTRSGSTKWERLSGNAKGIDWTPNSWTPRNGCEAWFVIDDVQGHRWSDRLNVARSHGQPLYSKAGPFALASEALLDQYGVPMSQRVRLSQFTPPKLERKGSGMKRSERAYYLDPEQYYSQKWAITSLSPDDFGEAYYVPVTTRAPEDLAHTAARWVQRTHKGAVVYGLAPSFLKALDPEYMPRDATDYMREEWLKLMADNSYHMSREAARTLDTIDADLRAAFGSVYHRCPLWQRVQRLVLTLEAIVKARPVSLRESELYNLGAGLFGSTDAAPVYGLHDMYHAAFRHLTSQRPAFALLWERMDAKDDEKTLTIIRTLAIVA